MKLGLWPRSLAAQLVLVLMAALLAAQVVTLVVFLQNRRSAVEAAAREQIIGRTAALVRLIEDTPPALQQRILDTAGSPRLLYSVSDTPLIAKTRLPPDGEAVVEVIAAQFGDRAVHVELADREWRPRNLREPRDHESNDGRDRREERDNRDRRSFRVPTVALSIALRDGRWLNAETQLPNPILWAWPVAVSTGLTAAAMLLAVGFSVRRITRPLRRLAEAADRLGRGETIPDLPEEGAEEVRRTTHAFNAMQARVRRFVDDRTRMIAAMSHDLRTPLTSLRLRAEFVDDDETREKMIDTIDEMTRMAEATLAFARDDAKDEDARRTDVAALVRAVVDDFADMGADVTATVPERLDLTVRPTALRRALRNLVENAMRYGERARVSVETAGHEIVIAVDDDGPGIPEDQLEAVFEPFTRIETSRSLETGGVGLGLSTARSIVRAHGGEIHLANRPGGGLTATIRLPA